MDNADWRLIAMYNMHGKVTIIRTVRYIQQITNNEEVQRPSLRAGRRHRRRRRQHQRRPSS